MGRRRRARVHQDFGSYHIVSRLVPEAEWWADDEKEAFLRLLERLARGFFVEIHAFCIMSNHFHLLVTGQEREAAEASEEELLKRYRAIHGKRSDPPPGVLQNDGSWDHDHDGGTTITTAASSGCASASATSRVSCRSSSRRLLGPTTVAGAARAPSGTTASSRS
ncbi:MAG: transposase [Planctomycetota bacterium]